MAPRRTITPSPPPESLKIGQSSGLHFYLSLLFRLARLVVGFFSCCAPSYLEDDALFFSSSSSFVPTCRLPIVAAGPVVVALLAFFSLYIYFFFCLGSNWKNLLKVSEGHSTPTGSGGNSNKPTDNGPEKDNQHESNTLHSMSISFLLEPHLLK